MSCHTNSWFYGNRALGLSGTYYGTLTRIRTPSSLPSTTCSVFYWVACRSTANNNRFYQATIAYTPTAGYWHFSWGYSPDHLSEPPYTGLRPTTNHDYELGIKFNGSNVVLYVVDLSTGITYNMKTVSDTGTMLNGSSDQPSFLMEGKTDQISEMNVSAFKAYTFNYFLSPNSSTEWPHATPYNSPASDYIIPSQIHTYDLGSHQYMIGNTSQGSQYPPPNSLW